MRGGNDTRAKRFAQNEIISWPRTTFRQDMLRVNHTRDGKPKFRFLVGHTMPARDHTSHFRDRISAPAQNFAEDAVIEGVGPCYQVYGHENLTSHRVDITHRVGGSNRAKSIGIINHGRKEIRCGDNRLLLIYLV